MKIRNTLNPYKELPYDGIQYGVCRDYNHISRYKALRQVTHNLTDDSIRFVALETPNAFSTEADVLFYDVSVTEENRLDLIAKKHLGSASYAWIIAYFNNIEDGFTVRAGQRIRIPKAISSLFNSGEVLAPISPLQLNLGTE